MAQTRACSKSSLGRLKPTVDTRVIPFDYTLEQLENDAATKWIRLAMTDEERIARLEKIVATAHLMLV